MNKTRITAFGLAILLVVLLARIAGAGSSAGFALDWWVLSGGGAPASTTGDVSLNGSLGQTAIGPSSNGSTISLDAGYWSGVRTSPPVGGPVYLPLILRSS
jgi:hypothetical protein